MTKKTYVKRLKKMLTIYCVDPGNHCPWSPKYSSDIRSVSEEECEMCQKFVGLKPRWDIGWLCCPCFRPNPKRATTRAWKAIEKYEQKYGKL